VWESRQPPPSTPTPKKPAKELKAALKGALKEAMTKREFEAARTIILQYERETGEKLPGTLQRVERNIRIQAKALEKAPEGRKRK
jgi:hypothetical protein